MEREEWINLQFINLIKDIFIYKNYVLFDSRDRKMILVYL